MKKYIYFENEIYELINNPDGSYTLIHIAENGFLTEDELNWIRHVLSANDSDADSKLTEDELNWLKHVLGEDYDYDPLKLPPHYVRLKKTKYERMANKKLVRKDLDDLREKTKKFTPPELLELKNKNVREIQGIENLDGIYIIHNRVLDIYYVGQAEKVLDRAYKHFVRNTGNVDIYRDYLSGDEFSISLIPLESTPFSNLNELEDNAIRAYDSLLPNGYNRMPGNIMDKPFFKNDDYQKAAELILDKIKGTEFFLTLSNDHNRRIYISGLLRSLKLPLDEDFISNFAKMIKEYQKANKKSGIK